MHLALIINEIGVFRSTEFSSLTFPRSLISYFRQKTYYFLTDENGHQIDSVGIKLHELPDDDHLLRDDSSPSKEKQNIADLHRVIDLLMSNNAILMSLVVLVQKL